MRATKYGIDSAFLRRFSPKAFLNRPVCETDLIAMIEAAMTAPSCFNEQPWRFVRGEKADFLEILGAKNAEWAQKAPEFLLVCSTHTFACNGKPNRWHAYDSGTAMGYLILEALKRDIFVHPMGGFSVEKAAELFSLDGLEPHAVLAIGYTDEPHAMTPRKPVEAILIDRRKP